MTMRYEARPIAENFYEIAQGGVRCFLFVGDDFALLIDSGFGGELRPVIEAITQKPVKLLHTHCDRDHIGASDQFEDLYMHPADFACCVKKNNLHLPLQAVWEGDCIEVGGYCLEIILIPGHTPDGMPVGRQNGIPAGSMGGGAGNDALLQAGLVHQPQRFGILKIDQTGTGIHTDSFPTDHSG